MISSAALDSGKRRPSQSMPCVPTHTGSTLAQEIYVGISTQLRNKRLTRWDVLCGWLQHGRRSRDGGAPRGRAHPPERGAAQHRRRSPCKLWSPAPPAAAAQARHVLQAEHVSIVSCHTCPSAHPKLVRERSWGCYSNIKSVYSTHFGV